MRHKYIIVHPRRILKDEFEIEYTSRFDDECNGRTRDKIIVNMPDKTMN